MCKIKKKELQYRNSLTVSDALHLLGNDMAVALLLVASSFDVRSDGKGHFSSSQHSLQRTLKEEHFTQFKLNIVSVTFGFVLEWNLFGLRSDSDE